MGEGEGTLAASRLVGRPTNDRQAKKEAAPRFREGPRRYSRRRPTLPHGLPCSTIGAGGLNFSVRNGKRCFPSAIATGMLVPANASRRCAVKLSQLKRTTGSLNHLTSKSPIKPHGRLVPVG